MSTKAQNTGGEQGRDKRSRGKEAEEKCFKSTHVYECFNKSNFYLLSSGQNSKFVFQVFQRVISRTGGPGLTVDELLENFSNPLLLLWGELDPWIRPAAADKIQVGFG